ERPAKAEACTARFTKSRVKLGFVLPAYLSIVTSESSNRPIAGTSSGNNPLRPSHGRHSKIACTNDIRCNCRRSERVNGWLVEKDKAEHPAIFVRTNAAGAAVTEAAIASNSCSTSRSAC